MGQTSLDVTCNGTVVMQQVTRPVGAGFLVSASVVLLTGTSPHGSTFARLSLMDRSGPSLLPVMNLVSGYVSSSSEIQWAGFVPLLPTQELVLDVWSSQTGPVVRSTIITQGGYY